MKETQWVEDYYTIKIYRNETDCCGTRNAFARQRGERYHGKNVVFVSIGVDKVEFKATWKQMVADKQLGGLQLFADNSFDSAFLDAYAVNSIPRFILIDPESKIVNPNAPQPSFDKTRELLDGLLN